MPIEFHCTDCEKLLRVADESEGKACYCPNCSKLLTIPSQSPVEVVKSKGEAQSKSFTQGEIEVPCPKCRYLLKCDAKLEGTRGCCASCAHVFTISTHAFVEEVDEEVFAFACPQCGQLFEGKPEMEGRKGKCTGCASVFIIERHVPKANASQGLAPIDNVPKPIPAAKPQAIQPTPKTSKPSTSTVSSNLKENKSTPNYPKPTTANTPELNPATPDPLGGLDFANMVPSVTTPTNVSPYSMTPTIAIHSSKRHRKSDSGKVILKALGIVAGIFGVMLLLCCGGIGIFYFAMSGKQTLTLGGYSVSAPATQRVNTPSPANTQAIQVANRFTKSHFAILLLQQPGLTPEIYMTGLGTEGRVISRQSVSRAGLNGIHFEFGGGGVMPKHTGEAFQSNNGVILLMYANGVDLATLEGKTLRMDRQQTLVMDKPDEFFASLKPANP